MNEGVIVLKKKGDFPQCGKSPFDGCFSEDLTVADHARAWILDGFHQNGA